MASKQVKTSDLVQKGIFKEVKEDAKKLLEVLDDLNKGLISSAEAFKKIGKDMGVI